MKRIAAFLTLAFLGGPLAAQSPKIIPEGKLVEDPRVEALKDLNGYFPFDVPTTVEAWETRAEELRRRVLVANGLWPMPERTPLNAVIHGKVEREGFTVEKVYFESVPGFFVTGLLFRPEGPTDQKRPAVLCPHGHGGRLQDHGADGVLKQIAMGAERFEESGRMPKVARAVTLARLGCVTFLYDMIGYADNRQLSQQLAHGFKKQRPDMEGKESWGLFSTQAEMRLQSVFGLHTWNSIRALDFLESLPDVDPKRIGVTGGSGGGTQTIILGAIDPRPIVAFPNGMVSTSMQGGCTCENTALLRIRTGNVELAGLFAPRPQGMTAANDWTKEMMTKGYPDLQHLYQLYGKKDHVLCEPQTHFPHNYNYVTRGVMYQFFNKHLGLGLPTPIVEEDFPLLTSEEHAVWDAAHPEPEGGDAFERKLTRYLADESDRQFAQLKPGSDDYLELVGGAWKTMIGYDQTVAKLKVPLTLTLNPEANASDQSVIWIDGQGKDGLYDSAGMPLPGVAGLVKSGVRLVTADLFMQGEYLGDEAALKETRSVPNPREFAGYTFGYNDPLFAQRVHDILNLIAAEKKRGVKTIHLVGTHGAGQWVAAARAVGEAFPGKTIVDTGGFRFADLTSYRHPEFLPGSVKYGDVPGLLALLSPNPLWILGEGDSAPELVSAAFQATGMELKSSSEKALPEVAIDWLMK